MKKARYPVTTTGNPSFPEHTLIVQQSSPPEIVEHKAPLRAESPKVVEEAGEKSREKAAGGLEEKLRKDPVLIRNMSSMFEIHCID